MNEILMQWPVPGQGHCEERVADFESVVNRLSEIREEFIFKIRTSPGVDVVLDGIGTLTVGVGDGEWTLMHASWDKMSFLMSVGDKKAEGTEWFYFGDGTELSRKYLIPREKALEAVRVWCTEGKLSENVEWTYEIF